MRRALAALLVSLQLQPLWGLVLCLSVVAPEMRAAEHCAGTEMPTPATGAPILDVGGSLPMGHGCPLAEACTPAVVAAPVPAIAAQRIDPSLGATINIVDVPRLLARGAPPTPPPNL